MLSKAMQAAALVCLLVGCGSSDSSGQDAQLTVMRESGVAGESSGDCHGPGRYRAAKEGSYRPCCPGLREVFYTGSTFAEGGAKVCAELPMRIYACVQGRCGDGVCEAGEAEACGCVADCPSALWGDVPTGEVGN
jgi:hypothetical protein